MKSENELQNWRVGKELINNKNILYEEANTKLKNCKQKSQMNSILVIDNEGEIAGIAKINDCLSYQPKVVFNAYG